MPKRNTRRNVAKPVARRSAKSPRRSGRVARRSGRVAARRSAKSPRRSRGRRSMPKDVSMSGGNGQCDLSHAAPVGAEGFADGAMDDLAL